MRCTSRFVGRCLHASYDVCSDGGIHAREWIGEFEAVAHFLMPCLCLQRRYDERVLLVTASACFTLQVTVEFILYTLVSKYGSVRSPSSN